MRAGNKTFNQTATTMIKLNFGTIQVIGDMGSGWAGGAYLMTQSRRNVRKCLSLYLYLFTSEYLFVGNRKEGD